VNTLDSLPNAASDSPFEASEHSPVRGAQLVALTARVLRALASAHDAGMRISELVEQTGLPRATVNRIVRALQSERLAMRRLGEPRYVLGPLAFELGLAASRHFRLRELAAPSMERLAALTGDACFLIVSSGQDAVCIDRREGSYPVRTLVMNVGDRRPLGVPAAGIALLAHVAPKEVEQYLGANAARIERFGTMTPPLVKRMLADARKQGYALIKNHVVPDVTAVGMSIPARCGLPYAALSVSAMTSRMAQRERLLQVVHWLQAETRGIAAELNAA
jgi:DNA-binding IclR family transcriptional regulator